MSEISQDLKSVGTLLRNSPSQSASGAYPDSYAAVKTGVRCRIAQPRSSNYLVGYQDVAELEPVVLFEDGEDVREQDRIQLTGGEPARLVGTTWTLRGVVGPSESGAYLRANGRRVQTASG